MLAAQIETEHPGPLLELMLESRRLYGEVAPELTVRTGINPQHLASGILSAAFHAEEEPVLRKRFEWQQKAGLVCEWWTPEQIAAKFPFFKKSFGGLWAPQDAQVSSGATASAFAEAARKLGVDIYENEGVNALEIQEPRLEGLETHLSRFTAGRYVFAAGAWIGTLLNARLPVQPMKGQILIYDLPQRLRKEWKSPVYCGKVPGPEPMVLYFVPKEDGTLLVGATVETRGFDKSENPEATARMAKAAAEVFPELARLKPRSTWQGLRPGTPDLLPVMGPMPRLDNVFVAGGHFRNGILLAPITGKLMAELLIDGKTSLPIDAFSPARFS
jgi:glycine oxidase